ncbi:MAG TPA: cytochrome P450 [Nevskiaceae bacterium]|nr:cytochrome P450 [Nevskiaceae bacterium]
MNTTADVLADVALRGTCPLKEIPGDRGLPVLGYTLQSLRDPIALLQRRFARYGEASWSSMYFVRMISLLGPDANQFVYENREEVFANSGWNYFLAKFFPRGLMLLDFDEHRMHRRIMQGAFRKQALANYLAMMQPVIAERLAAWQPREGFLAYDHFKALTLEIGSRVFVGESPGEAADALNRAFFATVQAPSGVVRFGLPGSRWAAGLHGRRVLEKFFVDRIAAKRASTDGDLFSELCHAQTEDDERFSDSDVVNHMIFLLMAAHDTSTITLTNMVYQLAKHPEWQGRLREESKALGAEAVDHASLPKLESMDLVMRETLRLVPPVPFMPRLALRETVFKGFRIPARSYVTVAPCFTHMMPEWWTEPERFDPERFAEPRREDRRHPYSWIPFGGGAHKCIGLHFADMAIKTILHRMLLRFSWSVPDGYTMVQDHTSLPVPRDRLPIRLRAL